MHVFINPWFLGYLSHLVTLVSTFIIMPNSYFPQPHRLLTVLLFLVKTAISMAWSCRTNCMGPQCPRLCDPPREWRKREASSFYHSDMMLEVVEGQFISKKPFASSGSWPGLRTCLSRWICWRKKKKNLCLVLSLYKLWIHRGQLWGGYR